MLAHDYLKQGHRIKFPCDAQVKSDGLRCLGVVTQQVVKFISRGGKEYKVPQHMMKDFVSLWHKHGDFIIDGELYIHGLSLQNITSCVKKHNDNTPRLEYHVFDVVNDKPWSERKLDIPKFALGSVKAVESQPIQSEEQLFEALGMYEAMGFEGAIIRNLKGLYTYNQRSADLQKLKNFVDAEFKIIDINEDKNNEAVFVCEIVLKDGTLDTFDVKMKGTHEERMEPVSNPNKFIGRALKVKYQALTDIGKPQFPVGLGIRVGTFVNNTFKPED